MWLHVCKRTHREHEEGVKHESHGRKGLKGGHHVPLQAQREHNEQRHGDQQQHAETARYLFKEQTHKDMRTPKTLHFSSEITK